MRRKLLDVLVCPKCGGDLDVLNPGGGAVPEEIDDGTLRCQGCRGEYPVRNGVPILLVAGSGDGSGSGGKWSFDYQWGLKFKGMLETGDWLWGKDLERISYKMRVQNCWHLDCGSGSGDHTRRIAEQNPTVQVVGLDRSDSVLRTSPRDRRIPNLHYVRASILEPPFREGSFRTIMAVGSLHATGDTRRGIRQCVRLLEQSGYLSTWLYPNLEDLRGWLATRPRWQGSEYDTGNGRPRDGGEYHMWQKYYFFRDVVFMGVGHRLPPPLLYALCQVVSGAISPFGHLLRLKVPKLIDRIRSNTFILYDDISPEYQDRPSKEQVFAWLREAGCGQVTYSFRRGGVFTGLRTAAVPAARVNGAGTPEVRSVA